MTIFRRTLVRMLDHERSGVAMHDAKSASVADSWADMAHQGRMAADRLEQLIRWYDEEHPGPDSATSSETVNIVAVGQ